MMQSIERLLKKSGFQILGKDQKETVITKVDGKDHFGYIEAAYTVKKENKNYVVFIKEGEEAVDPTSPAQRRKLIELDRGFGLSGVLVVDLKEEEIHLISFKFPRERGIDFYFHFFIAIFLILLVIGIIWLLVQVRLY